MTSYLRTHPISIKSLVLTLLLSFIGQAWGLADICTMQKAETSHVSPCHQMVPSAEIDASNNMDCCDSPTITNQHDCSCPDSSGSASVPFLTQDVTSSFTYNEQANSYSQLGLPHQISSALFRPPIV